MQHISIICKPDVDFEHFTNDAKGFYEVTHLIIERHEQVPDSSEFARHGQA
jgi:hypothetical protein